MTDVLILYGTTDGHTARVAARLGDDLRSLGAQVDVRNAAARPEPAPESYRAVIVAASVHAGEYQTDVHQWARRHAGALAERPTAFVSVCLGVLQHDPAVDEQLDSIMQKFFAYTGWTPTARKIVAGALPYTKFNLIKRLMMRRIMRKAHGDTDTTRNYEYTDWKDLAAFARTFAGRVPGITGARAAG